MAEHPQPPQDIASDESIRHIGWDPVDLKVASIIFREARRAHRYTPADERAERVAEEQADEE